MARVIEIDWPGARLGSEQRIWIAEAVVGIAGVDFAISFRLDRETEHRTRQKLHKRTRG